MSFMIGVLEKTFNVGCKKIIKHDLLWNTNKGVALEDYTLDLKMIWPHRGSSLIKKTTNIKDHHETVKHL
jgi:hypothetical protein